MKLSLSSILIVGVLLFNIKEAIARELPLNEDIKVEPEELFETGKYSSNVKTADIQCLGHAVNAESSQKIIPEFYFSSRNQITAVKVQIKKEIDFGKAQFDAKKKTVFIIHGFKSNGKVQWVKEMTEAYLKFEDVNVFAVDWSQGSNFWRYWKAVEQTKVVGQHIADFINKLNVVKKLDIKNCHLVGHSLGAHIAGFAGKKLNKVGRITGLDPAFPCFNTRNLTKRLDSSDAEFVDVIHTNGKTSFGFGTAHRIGHVDFYPNGGMLQPGCSSMLPGYNVVSEAVCSHGRSYIYFTESLINKKCSFAASSWDLTIQGSKHSIEAYTKGKKNSVEMGINASIKKRGSFFLLTADKAPYCVSDWQSHLPKPEILEDLNNLSPPLDD